MWAAEGAGTHPGYLTIALVCISGGLLGVVFMVPLRSALIVKEHGTLPYPEGKACAEVLVAGEKGALMQQPYLHDLESQRYINLLLTE